MYHLRRFCTLEKSLFVTEVHFIPALFHKVWYNGGQKCHSLIRGVFWRETPHEHVLNQTLFLSLTVAPLRNVVSFNVNGFNIEKKERLSSAKLRVMVEIASHVPSLPLRGDIVLYDQFSHEAIQSVAFRRSGTRWVMFSVRPMVQRWLFSQRLNCGVFVRAKSHNPDVNVSIKVKGGQTGTRRNTLPLLIVKTHFVKHHRGEKLSSLLR